MQPFYAIYNRGTTLQFAFNDYSFHPHYSGAEFPIGQSLSAAINITEDEANKIFNKLINSFICYCDKASTENYKNFEKALFEIDEYCIYLRPMVHKLLEMIEKLHPRYTLSYLIHFIKDFTQEDMMQLTAAVSKINNAPQQAENKAYFWSLCVKFMLNTFLYDIKQLKDDIYDLCNLSEGYTGMSRLNVLDGRRKNFYLGLTFNLGHGMSIGEAENSKILVNGPLGNDDIINCLFVDEIMQAIYYEFFAVLENNLPFKLCKNCNLPFVPKGRVDSLYCDRVVPDAKDKCSTVGAHNTYKSNLSDIEADFYAARRRYNTRVSRNPLLKMEFEAWKIKARQKLTEYRNGEISAVEFREWFMDDEWTRIYKFI